MNFDAKTPDGKTPPFKVIGMEQTPAGPKFKVIDKDGKIKYITVSMGVESARLRPDFKFFGDDEEKVKSIFSFDRTDGRTLRSIQKKLDMSTRKTRQLLKKCLKRGVLNFSEGLKRGLYHIPNRYILKRRV